MTFSSTIGYPGRTFNQPQKLILKFGLLRYHSENSLDQRVMNVLKRFMLISRRVLIGHCSEKETFVIMTYKHGLIRR